MFNQNFYPTPQALAERMVSLVDNINSRDFSILEPSAGKGDLAEVIDDKMLSRYRYLDSEPKRVNVIEIEPELQAILREKNFRVVGDDFLSFQTFERYNLIVMNPPFDNGVKHVLKAISMLKHGGQLITLLNAETLKNAYTNERKTLLSKLNQYNAHVEYLENGFSDAERKTNVEVALVSLVIPEEKGKLTIFDDLIKRKPIADKEMDEKNDLAINDFVQMIVQQFENEAEIGLRIIDEIDALEPYMTKSLDKDDFRHDDALLHLTLGEYDRNSKVTPNNFMYHLRVKYWKALFTNPRVTEKMPSTLLSKFRSKISEFGNYDFNVRNIKAVQLDMSREIASGIDEEILTLFKDLSMEYAYDKYSTNIHYYNGFSTNKSWYVNNKVIIPKMAYSTWSNKLEEYSVLEYMRNLENILNYLNGGGDIVNKIANRIETINFEEQGNAPIESEYFTVRFYKKGTAHITFTDEDLLKRFNIYAGRHFNWLPPHYGTQSYDDMTPEEQAVIDDFQGKEDYDRVLENREHYLPDMQRQANLALPLSND